MRALVACLLLLPACSSRAGQEATWVQGPPRFSQGYHDVAREAGRRVKLVVLEGEGHEILLTPAVFAALTPLMD